LAFGLERPLYGISSMDALADSALRRNQEKNPAPPNWILTYRDARHGEIFTALFGPCSFEEQSAPTCPRAGQDRVSPPEEVQLPETGAVLLAGREEDLPPAWSGGSLGPRFQILNIPSAPDGVARLTWEALRRGDPPAGPEIQPIYGRKPRAETQWTPPGA
jgi:tRNA A37 threonylcarbamoyladenosine modification protein TsaB